MSYIKTIRGNSKVPSIEALESSSVVAFKGRFQLSTVYEGEGSKLLLIIGASESSIRLRWLLGGGNGVDNIWNYVTTGTQVEEAGGISAGNGHDPLDWVVLYAGFSTSTNQIHFAAWNATKGISAFEATKTLTDPPPSGAGQGAISIADFGGFNLDGLAIYNTLLTGADRFSEPKRGDAGIITGWVFEENNGTNIVVGGPLLPSHASDGYISGGVWGDGPAPDPTTVTIDQANPQSVVAGSTLQLSATVTDPVGATTWSSSASGVATINSSTGLVTGVSAGSATITAANNGITDTITVTVTAPVPLPEVTILTPNGLSVSAGAKIVLEAQSSGGTGVRTIRFYRGTPTTNLIGIGDTVTFDTTSLLGQISVTARVTDANDQTADATIQIGIGEAIAPTTTRGRKELTSMHNIALREPVAAWRTIYIKITDAQGDGVNVGSGQRAQIGKAGAALTQSSATLTHRANGWHALVLSEAECDSAGLCVADYKNGENEGSTLFTVTPEPGKIQTTVTSATSRRNLVVPSGLPIHPGQIFEPKTGPAAGSMALVESYNGTALVLASPGVSAQPTANNIILIYAAPAVDQVSGASLAQIQAELAPISAKTGLIPTQPAARGDIPTADITAIKTSTDRLTISHANAIARIPANPVDRNELPSEPDNARIAAIKTKTDLIPASGPLAANAYVAPDNASIAVLIERFTHNRANMMENLALLDKKISEVQAGEGASVAEIVEGIDQTSVMLTQIRSRLPNNLVGGRMDSNVGAIDGNTESAQKLSRSARGITFANVMSGASFTTIPTSLMETRNDFYTNRMFILTSGKGKTGAAIIEKYDGATKTLIVKGLVSVPELGDEFVIV